MLPDQTEEALRRTARTLGLDATTIASVAEISCDKATGWLSAIGRLSWTQRARVGQLIWATQKAALASERGLPSSCPEFEAVEPKEFEAHRATCATCQGLEKLTADLGPAPSADLWSGFWSRFVGRRLGRIPLVGMPIRATTFMVSLVPFALGPIIGTRRSGRWKVSQGGLGCLAGLAALSAAVCVGIVGLLLGRAPASIPFRPLFLAFVAGLALLGLLVRAIGRTPVRIFAAATLATGGGLLCLRGLSPSAFELFLAGPAAAWVVAATVGLVWVLAFSAVEADFMMSLSELAPGQRELKTERG